MTSGAIDFVVDRLRTKIDEFPYLIIYDRFHCLEGDRLSDLKQRINADVEIFHQKGDFRRIRLKIQDAKEFKLGPAIFVIQYGEPQEYFEDFVAWLGYLDLASEIELFIAHELTEEELPVLPEDVKALLFYVIKQNLFDGLKKILKKLSIKVIEAREVHDLLLCTVFNLDYRAFINSDLKVRELFKIILLNEHYRTAVKLLGDENIGPLIERLFSVNKVLMGSLLEAKDREKALKILVGLCCIPPKNVDKLIPPLFERFGAKEKGQQTIYKLLHGAVKEFLIQALRDPAVRSELKQVLARINEFAQTYKDLWLNNLDLSKPSNMFGFVQLEFDWFASMFEKKVCGIPAKNEIKNLKRSLEEVRSWPTVSISKERFSVLKKCLRLAEILASLPKKLKHWNGEMFNVYDLILQGDFELLIVRRSTEFDEKVHGYLIDKYTEARNKILESYEQYLQEKYPKWLKDLEEGPLMPDVILRQVLKLLQTYDVVFLGVYDGLRFDLWKELKRELIGKGFSIEREERLCSLIPSTTSVSREAIFLAKIPTKIRMVDEGKALEKVLWSRARSVYVPSVGSDVRELRELTAEKPEATKEVRVFVCDVADRVGHGYYEKGDILTLIDSFRSIAKVHASHLQRISKIRNSVLVIATDHGFTVAENIARISQSAWLIFKEAQKKHRAGGRYASLKPRSWLESQGLLTLEKDQRFYVFTPKQLALSGEGGKIIIPRGEFRFPIRMKIVHGGLSMYETIIPLCILIPPA